FSAESYGDGDDCVEALGRQLPVRFCLRYGSAVVEGAGAVDGASVWGAGICGACVGVCRTEDCWADGERYRRADWLHCVAGHLVCGAGEGVCSAEEFVVLSRWEQEG